MRRILIMEVKNLIDVVVVVAKAAGKLLPKSKQETLTPGSNMAVAIAPATGDSRDFVIAFLCVAIVALSFAVVAASQRA